MNIRGKVKGGALSYAVFLIIVSIILVGAVITIAYYYFVYHERNFSKQLLVQHANSLLNAAQYKKNIDFPWNGAELELFPADKYEIEVSHKTWGLYSVLSVDATYKHLQYQRSVLCGSTPVLDGNSSLYLSNFKDELYVAGNTIIRGNSYLPKNGVERAFIEGTQYHSDT